MDAGAGGDQLIKAVHQTAAAGHDDAVGGHIRHQLRGRPLQHRVDSLHNALHRFLKGVHHLRGADSHHLGKTRQQTAALDVHGLLLVLGEDTADLLFHLLGGALTHQQIVLAAHILHHSLIELVAGDLDRGGFHHTGEGDHSDIRRTAADVHHHVAVGLGDVDARADGRRYRLLNKIHLPGAGLNTGIDDGALLNLRDTGGHADDDPGLEEGKARDLMNKLLEHPLRHIVVGDNALPQRPDGDDVAGGTAQHSLRVRAHLQQLAGGLIHSHHRGLVEHNALALYIYQYGGGTQVDTDIFCDPHRDTSCSFRKCCTESIISGISVRNHTFSIITVHIPDCKTGIMNFFPFSPAASGRR